MGKTRTSLVKLRSSSGPSRLPVCWGYPAAQRDEILFRTFSGGHIVLWLVGLVTSLLTAIYMFRLVFMAFHGSSNATAETDPTHRADSTDLPHSAHLHDAPPPMALALIVLAIGSVVAALRRTAGGAWRRRLAGAISRAELPRRGRARSREPGRPQD